MSVDTASSQPGDLLLPIQVAEQAAEQSARSVNGCFRQINRKIF
jgi:hypothetical protein